MEKNQEEEEDREGAERDKEEDEAEEEDEEEDEELTLCLRCKRLPGFVVCSKCGVARYCSQLCLTRHWKTEHRKTCSSDRIVGNEQNTKKAKTDCLCCFCECDDGFRCKKNFKHAICMSCFPHMVRSASENYMNGEVPVRCPDPECAQVIADHIVRSLLMQSGQGESSGPLVWDAYQTSQLRAGLIEKKEEVPVTCPRCNQYTELMPRDYKEQARYAARQVQKEAVKKDSTDKATESKTKESKNKGKDKGKNKGKKKDTITAKTKPPLQQQRALVDPFADMDTGLAELAPLSLFRQESAFTGNFFRCGLSDCDGALCLVCNRTLNKDATFEHQCEQFEIPGLEERLLDILAEGAVQHCPQCKAPGRKDLACSHITCEQCKQRWCYVCEAKIEDLPDGNFSEHNEFMLGVTPNNCPMYLQYKYGMENFDIVSGRYDGRPEYALDLFHAHMQFTRYEQFVQKLPDFSKLALRELIRRRFPKGLFEEKVMTDLKSLANQEISYGREKLQSLLEEARNKLDEMDKEELEEQKNPSPSQTNQSERESKRKSLEEQLSRHEAALQVLEEKEKRMQEREGKISAAVAAGQGHKTSSTNNKKKKKKKGKRGRGD
eukprot:g70342.t1